MTYRIPLPSGGRNDVLDIIEPNSTAVQRFLRRDGLAAYEPPTVATLLTLFGDLDEGFTFFDVGANMGLYALLCAALFEPGAVHAFEPTPDTAAILRRIVKANQCDVEVFEAAVGDATGRATLHLSEKSDASNSMVAGFKNSHVSVEVESVRVDDHVLRGERFPDVMKIDVETFEPAVLAGAAATIERDRPFIVIEVLNRQGRDHGLEITSAMENHRYSYYELTDVPSWDRRPAVSGNARSAHKDWLLAPEPLDAEFGERWASWRSRLDQCGPDRNSRVPMLRSAGAAMKRGGVREVVATGRRYLAALRRQ